MNSDILGLIVQYNGEINALITLKKYIDLSLYQSFYGFKLKKLIYGEVQSGKTQSIIYEIKRSIMPVILIIQNSKLVQKQYEFRLREKGIDYQTINKETTTITSRVIILMNNKHQLNKYQSLNKYIDYCILLDESDITQKHPLRINAKMETHITATPFGRYKPSYFNQIQFID